MIWAIGAAGALGLAALVFGLMRARTGLTEDDKDAVPLRLGEVPAWVRRMYAGYLQVDATLRARAAAALESEGTAIARARNSLLQATGGRPPVAMFLLFALLAAVSVWGFEATYSIDQGLLETLHAGEQQANVFALFVAVITFAIGTVLVETLAPHSLNAGRTVATEEAGELDAVGAAQLHARRGGLWRLPLAVVLGGGFLVIVGVMIEVAPTRAERANASLVEAAEAACTEIEGDPLASAADRELVCAEASDKRADLERGVLFDRLLAAGAPAADLIGALGAIRFLELLVVMGLTLRARRAVSRRHETEAAVARALPDFTARIYRLITRADVPRGISVEVDRELRSLGITFDPPPVPPDPPAPPAGPDNGATGQPDITPQQPEPAAAQANEPDVPDEDPPAGPDEFDRY